MLISFPIVMLVCREEESCPRDFTVSSGDVIIFLNEVSDVKSVAELSSGYLELIFTVLTPIAYSLLTG